MQASLRTFFLLGLFASVGLYSAVSCSQHEEQEEEKELTIPPQRQPSEIDYDALPYKTLSEYGFFIGNPGDHIPNDGVLLYRPSAHLFTDYAEKLRYIYMPDGSSASIMDDEWEQIDFPDGAILIKTFYYPTDAEHPEGEKDLVETRLLVKHKGKWEAYPYRWNENQTDADLKVIGGVYPVTFTDAKGKTHSIDYVQPNKNQCKGCHNQDEVTMPIGPKARNMNYDITYPDGSTMNQLAKWAEVGYLDNFTSPADYTAVVDHSDETADLHLRAMSYLDGNCGHCHNPRGPGETSGLFLTYEQENPSKLGVYKNPVAAGAGAGPHKYDIYPGKADSSIVVFRMNSTQTGIAMPELGRVMIHEEGVALISEWINNMKPSDT